MNLTDIFTEAKKLQTHAEGVPADRLFESVQAAYEGLVASRVLRDAHLVKTSTVDEMEIAFFALETELKKRGFDEIDLENILRGEDQ